MQYKAPAGIRDILRIYNIPHGISPLIIPLEEAADRGMEVDLEESKDVSSYIEDYDALFSTGLSKEYVDKREFDLFISIRRYGNYSRKPLMKKSYEQVIHKFRSKRTILVHGFVTGDAVSNWKDSEWERAIRNAGCEDTSVRD